MVSSSILVGGITLYAKLLKVRSGVRVWRPFLPFLPHLSANRARKDKGIGRPCFFPHADSEFSMGARFKTTL